MSRVDFYILPDVDSSARQRFACRLAYKAFAVGQRVHVHVDDAAQEEKLDALMWEYPPENFLPHARTSNGGSEDSFVVIDHRNREAVHDGLLINLSARVPAFFDRFARVAEVIAAPDREQGRERFRFYRHEGCPLYHHELEDWER